MLVVSLLYHVRLKNDENSRKWKIIWDGSGVQPFNHMIQGQHDALRNNVS